jgi:hypothetical protein
MSGVPIRFLIGLVVLLIAGDLIADAQRVVPAEEIRKEIYRGEPVFYQDALIVGDLYLDPVPLENKSGGYSYFVNRPIPPIYITNSTIQGSVSFSGKVFNKTINFGHTHITGTTDFSKSKFYGNTYFVGTYFDGLGPLESLGSGIFWGSYFGKETDFSESRFNGTANFR